VIIKCLDLLVNFIYERKLFSNLRTCRLPYAEQVKEEHVTKEV